MREKREGWRRKEELITALRYSSGVGRCVTVYSVSSYVDDSLFLNRSMPDSEEKPSHDTPEFVILFPGLYCLSVLLL
jgi:hypothetical protein